MEGIVKCSWGKSWFRIMEDFVSLGHARWMLELH